MTAADEVGGGVRDRLDSIRQRLAQITPGPWDRVPGGDQGSEEVFVPNGTMSTETVMQFADFMDCEECARPSDADAEFIAAAPTDVAGLLLAAVDAVLALADEADREGATVRPLWIRRAVAAHLNPKENPND